MAISGSDTSVKAGWFSGSGAPFAPPDEPGQLAAVHGDVGPGGQQIAQDDVGGDLIAHEGRCAADGGAHDHSTHGAGGSVGVGHIGNDCRRRDDADVSFGVGCGAVGFALVVCANDFGGFGGGPVRTGAHLIGPGGGRGIGELAAQSTAALVLYLYNSIPARPADAVRHESTCAQFWIILPFLL
ncbi:MAG TPA: hypothetical protein DCR92_07980 [Faecalibacterium sp.]|nr:hypothetical protein [Faecalibacterium sp.]